MRSRRFSSLRACFSTSSGICASVIALSSSAISAAPSSPSPSSFWIVRICSRSRCLRLVSLDRLARALVDLARDLQHLDAVREELEQLVEPRLEVERLEQRLLFLGADVHQAGDEIGEPRGAFDALQRGDHFLRHLRQQLQDLEGALLQTCVRALRSRVRRCFGSSMNCTRATGTDSRRGTAARESAARPGDRVMRAVGRGDVAQHVGGRADPVQVVGTRLVDVGLLLQQHAERTLRRTASCAAARERSRPTVSGKTMPGNMHDVAHRAG